MTEFDDYLNKIICVEEEDYEQEFYVKITSINNNSTNLSGYSFRCDFFFQFEEDNNPSIIFNRALDLSVSSLRNENYVRIIDSTSEMMKEVIPKIFEQF